MEELKKLIDVLERKGKGSASALLNYTDTASLETRLFQLAQAEADKDEANLIGILYNEPTKQGAFRMLKSRVKRKLYNQLFFLDADNNKIADKLSSVEVQCRKLLYLADTLLKLQEATLAEQQLKKAIALAKDACLINCEIDGLEQLRSLMSIHKFNRKDFDKCVNKLEELYKLREIERKANTIFYDIRFDLKLGVETSFKFRNRLSDNMDDLQRYWGDTGSSLVFNRYHRLKMLYYELNGDALSHIEHLKEMFLLYKSGKIHPLYFSINFNKYLLVFAYLKAKQYPEGLLEAEELKHNIQEGTNNWFAHMENYLLLAVHSKDYQKAEKLLTEALENKYLKETTTFSQERWLIFYKFLNYISGFSIKTYNDRKLIHVIQDKKGYNVWLLILDFLLILEKKQPELIEREIDRVRKFTSKYLVNKEDARTKLFLKLLLIAGREFGDTKVCRRKGNYLFNKLQQTPTVGIAYAETEIIPFEHLWELLLQKMEKNH